MSDQTPEQSAALDALTEQHGEDCETVAGEEGAVILSTPKGKSFSVAVDGAETEVESSASGGQTEPHHPSDTGTESADIPALADQEQAGTEAHTEVGASASVPSTPTLDVSAVSIEPLMVEALSAADERQIQQEIEGRALGAMVYSFKQAGATVTGLSYKGVQEAVRQMNTRKMGRIKIAADPAPKFEEISLDVETGRTDDEGQSITEAKRAVRCTVYALDEQYGTARFGTATQLRDQKLSKKDKVGNPLWKPDSFADAKALSKASRNAQEGMLPLVLVEELKANYLGKESVEYITGVAVDVTDVPLALTDEKATKLGDEIREHYEEFKRTHPEGKKALTPGEFGRYFMGAQHDHKRLEDFKAFMQEQLAAARKLAEEKAAA